MPAEQRRIQEPVKHLKWNFCENLRFSNIKWFYKNFHLRCLIEFWMCLYHQPIFSITLRVYVSIKISYKTQYQFLIQIPQWLQTPSLSPCLAWSLRKTAFPCRILLAPLWLLKNLSGLNSFNIWVYYIYIYIFI